MAQEQQERGRKLVEHGAEGMREGAVAPIRAILAPARMISCPACSGTGMKVGPQWQGQDGLCELCHGAKLLCATPCRCGRPRRFDKAGFVQKVMVAGIEVAIFCCGQDYCKNAMKPRRLRARRVW